MRGKKVVLVLLAIGILLTFSACSATAHEHDWKEATESAPKTCLICGETEGEPLEKNPASDNSDTEASDLDAEILASILAKAEALAADENYEEALVELEKGLVLYPDSEELQAKLEEYNANAGNQEKDAVLAEAATLADAGDYEGAMGLIEDAQKTYGDDVDYQTAYDKYEQAYFEIVKAETLVAAEELANSADYLGAAKTIEEALKSIGNNDELSAKEQEYEDIYAENAVNEVYAFLDKGEVDSALNLLKEAQKNFPQNDILSAVKANPLDTYHLINTNQDDRGFNPEVAEDTFGNTYYEVDMINLPDDYYVEYTVVDEGVKYATFTIAAYHHYYEKRTGTLALYADDEKIWSSDVITRKSEPKMVSVAIPEGCKFIKFQCSANDFYCSDIMIIDGRLWT